ncbi:hypothetical protein Acsp05_16410 [Actinokineospora sp. NBRC 105648]|nr:hypothetical protein Acsp05_16410 [Actinokineospora sp. NBRC 105648]
MLSTLAEVTYQLTGPVRVASTETRTQRFAATLVALAAGAPTTDNPATDRTAHAPAAIFRTMDTTPRLSMRGDRERETRHPAGFPYPRCVEFDARKSVSPRVRIVSTLSGRT